MSARLAYSIAEAAEALSMSVRSLRYLMQTGKLGYVRVGRRVLIRHADLERLLNQGYCRATDRLDADEPIRPRKEEGLGRHPEAQTAESPNASGELLDDVYKYTTRQQHQR
jgi:excisionase family DNA binding protein